MAAVNPVQVYPFCVSGLCFIRLDTRLAHFFTDPRSSKRMLCMFSTKTPMGRGKILCVTHQSFFTSLRCGNDVFGSLGLFGVEIALIAGAFCSLSLHHDVIY
jgi:hypothetical protein